MTAKKEMPTEKIAQTAERALLKKLTDHTEVVETISEVWKDADGVVTKTHESTKEKLVKADLNAIIFVLKSQIGEKWNSDEKELNEAKLEKLRAEAGSLNGATVFDLNKRLSNYITLDSEQLELNI